MLVDCLDYNCSTRNTVFLMNLTNPPNQISDFDTPNGDQILFSTLQSGELIFVSRVSKNNCPPGTSPGPIVTSYGMTLYADEIYCNICPDNTVQPEYTLNATCIFCNDSTKQCPSPDKYPSCNPGYYPVGLNDSLSCLPCPENAYCVGSLNNLTCEANYYWDSSSCKPCPPTLFCPGGLPQSATKSCPIGLFQCAENSPFNSGLCVSDSADCLAIADSKSADSDSVGVAIIATSSVAFSGFLIFSAYVFGLRKRHFDQLFQR